MQRLIIFFCICFIGILLVWWLILREYNDYINRAGIILNFLSALMVSQDFLGPIFWTNVEEIAEKKLSKLENLLNRIKDRLEQCMGSDDSGNVETWNAYRIILAFTPVLLLFGLGSFCCLVSNTSLLPLSLSAAVIYLLSSVAEKKKDDFIDRLEKLISKFPLYIQSVFSFIFGTSYFILAGVVIVAAYPVLASLASIAVLAFLIFYPITGSLLTVMKLTAKMLSENDKLREIVKYWGIIFFLLGNLLQFISTFSS